jgi:anti-anti-sigma factor
VKIQTQAHGNITVLLPHGPLAGEETLDLRRSVEAARTAAGARVIVDMNDVPYLDSSGIEMLLELCSVDLSALQRPKLAALTDTCREALELTDVLPRLDVFDTVENAMRGFQR